MLDARRDENASAMPELAAPERKLTLFGSI
jgi:hypothetical protein